MSSMTHSDKSAPMHVALPAPLLVRRAVAAAMMGVSESSFDRAVKADVFPQPRVFEGCRLWYVADLTAAAQCLPSKGAQQIEALNPFDDAGEDADEEIQNSH